MTGERLDLSNGGPDGRLPHPAEKSQPFLGIQFACCAVYSRIYLNRAGTAYVGFCPKCRGRIEIQIGAEGSERRFFTAS